MSSSETVIFNLELEVSQQTLSALRQAETLAARLINFYQKMGLSADTAANVRQLEQLIRTIQLAHSSIMAFYAASGPVGWLLAGVGALTAAGNAGQIIQEYSHQTRWGMSQGEAVYDYNRGR